ncbi:hypothetical protein AYO44_03315 [Planctomycetaceae bacterium SCGC AG-212-F19]|nr:hypothetical protein AYO44_03315 [Planctomycetaceae bacterium SCGC AG-212-F19]
MPLRATWEGFLRLSLIAVPVKAFAAVAGSTGSIGFHQLHAKCKSRIRYQKVCPIHGPVPAAEIVPGYEYAKNEYVVLDPKELAQLRAGGERAVTIDAFIDPAALDPIYYGDQTYYLVPSGRAGEKPFAVLHRAMTDDGVHGVGTILLAGRERLVLLRPLGRLLAATVLHYADEVRAQAAYEAEVAPSEVSPEELRLARTLVEASTVKDFDFARYKDEYAGKVMKMIEARAHGKKGARLRTAEEPPTIINLMDALKQSLTQVKKPRSRAAGRARGKLGATGRRKTG